ncbi:MAG: hypothetical protein V1826_02565 [bacterium]
MNALGVHKLGSHRGELVCSADPKHPRRYINLDANWMKRLRAKPVGVYLKLPETDENGLPLQCPECGTPRSLVLDRDAGEVAVCDGCPARFEVRRDRRGHITLVPLTR